MQEPGTARVLRERHHRDDALACVVTRCKGLRKLCVKNCPVSDARIEAHVMGCPKLMKVKVRNCKGVRGRGVEWLREKRKSLILNLDSEGVDVDPMEEEEEEDVGGSGVTLPVTRG